MSLDSPPLEPTTLGHALTKEDLQHLILQPREAENTQSEFVLLYAPLRCRNSINMSLDPPPLEPTTLGHDLTKADIQHLILQPREAEKTQSEFVLLYAPLRCRNSINMLYTYV